MDAARKSPRKSVVDIDGVQFELKTVMRVAGCKKKRATKSDKVITFLEGDCEGEVKSSLNSTKGKSKSKRRFSGNDETDGEEEKMVLSSRKKGKVSVQGSKVESDDSDGDGLSAGGKLGFETQGAEADDEVEMIKEEEAEGTGLLVSQDDGMHLTQFDEFQTQETDEGDALEVQEQERRIKPRAASSLPIVFGEKVNKTKVLLECEGDAFDLSGDMGAVGRFTVDRRDDEFFLDLKGVIYKTTIVPSNTFFVVNVGQTEAKVESIMSDFVQLRADTNCNENETLVEGTLKDFTFDSDEEGERLAADGAEKVGSAPADDGKHEEGADDVKQAKKKKPASKAPNGGKVPAKKAVAGKPKVGRGKASAKGGVGKKPTVKKATKPKASTVKK